LEMNEGGRFGRAKKIQRKKTIKKKGCSTSNGDPKRVTFPAKGGRHIAI